MPMMQVLVLLEHGRGLTRWAKRYEAGAVYDRTPYDYGSAESDEVHVSFSGDGPDGGAYAFLRKGVLKVTGIDLVHVLRNLRAVRRADVVWTHTETEHLALGVLKGLRLPLPPVIAQSVWLVDRWPRQNKARRAVYRWAMRHAELVTTLSPVNAALLSQTIGREVRFVPYGVKTEPWVDLPPVPRGDGPLRVLALGNDMHRDWEGLRAVARAGVGEVEVRVLTRQLGPEFAAGIPSMTITQARSVTETAENFAWADVVCLPLHANLHASGITVLLEGAAWSKPCVVTDAGGLDAYFTADEVSYVPVGCSAETWLAALRTLEDPAVAARLVTAMRRRVATDEYSGVGFAGRHVAMSLGLLKKR
jgi:glycosyltransferase involved in cell wall biosynthesis